MKKVDLTFSNFFTDFLGDPLSNRLAPADRKIALAATILLGILTLGLAPLIARALHGRVKPIKESPLPASNSTSKTTDIAQKALTKSETPPDSVTSTASWEASIPCSDHQKMLHTTIRSIQVDFNWFTVKADHDSLQSTIGKMIQETALPLYKIPMPQTITRRGENNALITEGEHPDWAYNHFVAAVEAKQIVARQHHGAMHCARVVLWTQLLSIVYEDLGREKISNPVLLAAAGAFHDVGREADGKDYWDEESAEVLAAFLDLGKVDKKDAQACIHAIKEKDPENDNFSTDIQRIIHDADCLDVIRVRRYQDFDKTQLCFYQFARDDTTRKEFDSLIAEAAAFIRDTEEHKDRIDWEHTSENFYGEVVEHLLSPDKYPILAKLFNSRWGKKTTP